MDDKIVTNSTATTQWKSLVLEASQHRSITLTEELESYLVFLLMRFTEAPQIAHKVLGLEFLESLNRFGSTRSLALRDVGDQCLLVSGLFPERARRRRVRVGYFVEIGRTAYSSLATYDVKNELFATLAQQFVPLMDILQAMREVDTHVPTLDPIMAQEIWHDTGSDHALQTLRQFTMSTAPIFNDKISVNKH